MRTALFSLRYRIIISVVAIETVMLSIMVWSNTSQMRQAHLERLDRSAHVILQQFAATAGRYLFAVDYPSLREYAENVLKHTEIIYIVVKDNSGDTVIAIGDPPKPERLQDGGEAISASVLQVRDDVIFVGKPLGEVTLGFTLEVMEQTVAAALRRGILIAATEIALSIIAALLIGIALTRNLGRLAEFAQRFGRGEPADPLDIRSSDETGMLARAFDQMVSQRQSAERALRESERDLMNLIEGSVQGVLIVTKDRRPLFANRACAQIFGFESPDQILALESTAELIGPHELERLDEIRNSHFAEDKAPISYEFDGVRRDGSIVHLQCMARTIDWKGQRAAQITLLDFTERKRTEDALRLSEMRLSGILDISAEAIISVDQDQTIVMFNQGARNIFGYDAEEAIGKPLDMLLPGRVRAVHRSHVEGFDESRETTRLMMTERGEISGLRKDGTEFPAEASISKLDLGGQKVFTVTLRDVSERRRAEEQLRQAQKMEAVGQLTGGIAHDFNNLLGIMLGNAEILSERIGDDRQVQAVIRAATRGAELTQRMLAFSRQQPLQPKAIDVGALADGMAELLRRTLGETIAIKIATGKNLWTATADPGLVENALLNLALNARDAMPDGGTLIIETGNATLDETYAATRDDVTAGDYVLLSVTDTGTGMAPEVLSHVFEPFYTTKDIGKGSGLGLSMVYGFAKQSGGHIAIYSELGKGTTVSLYLPRTRAEAESSEVAPEAEAPRGRGEAVLVVEDDEDIRALVAHVLEGFGYRVRDAPDAAAGLALLEETPDIDLLITDMVLPGGMSGRDLAAEVARRFGVLKVLFMSGYSSEAVHLNGWVERGAELLRKPFRRHELATKVRAVLDRGPD